MIEQHETRFDWARSCARVKTDYGSKMLNTEVACSEAWVESTEDKNFGTDIVGSSKVEDYSS